MSGHRENIVLKDLVPNYPAQRVLLAPAGCLLATGSKGRTLCSIARMCKYNGNPASVAGIICVSACPEHD